MEQNDFLSCFADYMKTHEFKRAAKSKSNFISTKESEDLSFIFGLQKSRWYQNSYYIEFGISFIGIHPDGVPEKFYEADIRKRLKFLNESGEYTDLYDYSAWDKEGTFRILESSFMDTVEIFMTGGKMSVIKSITNNELIQVTGAALKYIGLPVPESKLMDISRVLEIGGILCISDNDYIENKRYYDEIRSKGGKVCIMNGKKAHML